MHPLGYVPAGRCDDVSSLIYVRVIVLSYTTCVTFPSPDTTTMHLAKGFYFCNRRNFNPGV